MHDQVGLDLDGFPLDQEFSEDSGQEEEDECDIEGEPFFEDELANQTARVKPKQKSKRTKAYTAAEDKLICEFWRDIGQDPKTGTEQKHSTFWIRVHCEFHERKKFPPYQIGHQRRGGFQGAICHPQVTWGKQAVEEVGDGEKARPWGKTNSKKEDKRDAVSNTLIANVEGMMRNKDSREEERRHYKEEQMNAFMEIQRRRLEMEAEKQAKMVEIEAANAKTKTKEVTLASMMTGVKIMKVDLNTVSPRKRLWFEKMQADIFKFDVE
ncbi:hypothetical protein VPH35_124514 [Triticum aestivum]